MSGAILKRFYRVDSFEQARAALRVHGLADDERLISRDHTTVDWLGETFDPPAQYDDDGNETQPGVNQGMLLNVYSRRADILEALDTVFERNTPDSPLRDLADAGHP